MKHLNAKMKQYKPKPNKNQLKTKEPKLKQTWEPLPSCLFVRSYTVNFPW